ncbi:hypothetical protein HK104_009513 [Borealophlyctis nickersoniae]|nr:hypothetical protein HK104_009513 [Borealophlyctis nickersoniae]
MAAKSGSQQLAPPESYEQEDRDPLNVGHVPTMMQRLDTLAETPNHLLTPDQLNAAIDHITAAIAATNQLCTDIDNVRATLDVPNPSLANVSTKIDQLKAKMDHINTELGTLELLRTALRTGFETRGIRAPEGL